MECKIMTIFKHLLIIILTLSLFGSCAEPTPESECGNGIIDPNEGCDDGNQRNSDSCPDGQGGSCQPARCGDGFLWNDYGGGEECDDGNIFKFDGCSTICQLELECGNGTIDPGEECDDGNQNNHDSCPDGEGGTCQEARCGDGFLWENDNGIETCDDGNQNNNDSCPDGETGSCQTASCGDGFVWNSDGGNETCDDGNIETGDGCSFECFLENCGNGTVETGEECDDGNQNNSDSCPDGIGGTCQEASCGDGFIWDSDNGVETCDDGNQANNDSCPDGDSGSCQSAICGDGFIWNIDGGDENCDDGNQTDGDECPDGENGTCQSTDIFAHTINIDGINDFASEETVDNTTTNFSTYVAWDDSYLYIGYKGSDISSGNGAIVVSLYLGTDSGTTTTTGFLHNTQEPEIPFPSTNYLFWTADNNFLDLHDTDGTSWNPIPSNGVTAYQSDIFVEFSIPHNSIGVSPPYTLSFIGTLLNTESMNEWTFAGCPATTLSDGYDPTLSTWYEFEIGGTTAPADHTPLP
jgi:cysteine-rich repeat protein